MTDTVTVALIAGGCTFSLGTLTLAVTYYQNKKLNKASDQNDRIIKAVDGPLGTSLKIIADLREDVARRTMQVPDIQAAAVARARSDDHEKEQVEIDLKKKIKESEDQKVIDKYKAEEKSKQP